MSRSGARRRARNSRRARSRPLLSGLLALACVLLFCGVSGISPGGEAAAQGAVSPARADRYAVDEDRTLRVAAPGVLANDVRVANRPSVKLAGGPKNGKLTLRPNGSFVYVPKKDFNGQDSFTYSARYNANRTFRATVTIRVRPVNDAPTARDDAYRTLQDEPLTVPAPGVLANDTDPDGDRLTAARASEPGNGDLALRSDGSLTYTPRAGYKGPDAFTYRARDGKGGESLARVELEVVSTNEPPTASSGEFALDEDTPAKLELEASDPNDDALTYAVVGAPEHGSLSGDGPRLTYTPDADYNGPDAFTFRASDGVETSEVAEVSLNVRPVNDRPSAGPGKVELEEDAESVSVDLTDFASDVETASEDLTYTLVSGPTAAQGALTGSGSSYTYTPAESFNGEVPLVFSVTDRGDPDACEAGEGCSGPLTSEAGTVTLDVAAVNYAPSVSLSGGPQGSEVDEGETPYTYTFTVSDSDPEDTFTVAEGYPDCGAGGELVAGSLAANADGGSFACRFPDGPAEPTVSVKVVDSSGAENNTSQVASVAGPRVLNVAPTANLTGPERVAESETEEREYTFTVTDPGRDTFTLAEGFPGCGSAGTLVAGSLATDAAGGSFRCVFPDGGPTSDPTLSTVTVRVVDKDGAADTADRPVEVVTQVDNVAPTARLVAPEAVDEGDDVAFSLVEATDPAGAADEILYSFRCESGAWSAYGPETDYTCKTTDDGTYTVSGRVSDEDGGESEVYSADVLVRNVAPAVTAGPDAGADEGENASFDLGSFTDPGSDADWTVSVDWGDGSEPESFTVSSPGDLGERSHAFPDDREEPYTVEVTVEEADGAAEGSDTFEVRVANVAPVAKAQSVSGGEGEDQVLTLSATDVPADEPLTYEIVALPENGKLFEGEGTAGREVLAASPEGPFVLDGTDKVTYRPPSPTFTGQDSFAFRASDGAATSESATVTVNVRQVNDPPTANADERTVAEDETLLFPASELLANDSPGPENERDQTLTLTALGSAQNGAAELISEEGAQQVRYVPDADYNGPDEFTYTVCDDGRTDGADDPQCATGTVAVTVTEVNDAPAGQDDEVSTDEDEAVVISVANLLANDSPGPENESAQTLTLSAVGGATGGTVDRSTGENGEDVLTFTPEADFSGEASFGYAVCDDGTTAGAPDPLCTDDGEASGTFPTTVSVDVAAVNDAPTLTLPESLIAERGVATPLLGISAADVDAGGGTVELTLAADSGSFAAEGNEDVSVGGGPGTLVLGGTLEAVNALISGGGVSFTPASDSASEVAIAVSVSDRGNTGSGGALIASGTVPVAVFAAPEARDDGPSANSAPGDPFHTGFEEELTLAAADGLLANDDAGLPAGEVVSFGGGDLGGTVESFEAGTTTPDGRLTVGRDGGLTFTPESGFTGEFAFRYRVRNDRGSSEAGVRIAVGERPTAGSDTYSTALVGNVAVDTERSSGFTVSANDTGSDGRLAVAKETNGRVNLRQDGTFVFSPNPGYRGAASFTYTVENGFGKSAPATVDLTVEEPVWFVDAGATSGGDGTFERPFNCLTGNVAGNSCFSGTTLDRAGDDVFLYSGSYTGGLTLLDEQRLVGQGTTGTDFEAALGVSWPADSGARPDVGGAAPTISAAASATNGVNLAQDNALSGLDFASATGSAVFGGNFGTLSVSEVGIDTTGQALDLTVGTLSGALRELTSRGGTNNVLLRSVGTAGAEPFDLGGGTLSGASSDAFKLDGGSGSFRYGGSVANTSTLAVNVQNKTGGSVTLPGNINPNNQSGGRGIFVGGNGGGTSVTFGGAQKNVSVGNGTGVSLANNAGSTVRFTNGGLRVENSGSAAGFAATGGGTVTVEGANNTLRTASGTALNVKDTGIGAENLTFASISSNGAPNGVVLDGTGTAQADGSLKVTGTGDACTAASPGCGGGRIQNTTGADGTTQGTGVYLRGTKAVSLKEMRLDNHANFAVRGHGVAGFELLDSLVDGTNGTNEDGAFLDSSLSFTELTGAATFRGVNVSGGRVHNLRVTNLAGTLDRVRIEDSTFGANSASGGHGVLLEPRDAATLRATVTNTSFTAARDNLFALVLSSGNPTADLVFENNRLSNSQPSVVSGGGGMTLSGGGTVTYSPNLTYNVSNNTFRDASGSALTVSKVGGAGSYSGTISGNTIGVPDIANSGSLGGNGIRLITAVQGTFTTKVESNQVYQYNGEGAILLQAGGVSQAASGTTTHDGKLDATVTNNTISNPGNRSSLTMEGIHLNSGTTSNSGVANGTPDAYRVCADISGNTLSGAGKNGGAGFTLRQRFDTGVNLPGYGGAQYEGTQAAAYVSSRNGGTFGQASSSGAGAGFTGGASCATP